MNGDEALSFSSRKQGSRDFRGGEDGVKTDNRKRTKLEMWGEFSGLQETMESDG